MRGLLSRRGHFQLGPFVVRVAPATAPVFIARRAARWGVRWRYIGRFHRLPLVQPTVIIRPLGIGVPIRVQIPPPALRLAHAVAPAAAEVDPHPVRLAHSVPALELPVGTPVRVNGLTP